MPLKMFNEKEEVFDGLKNVKNIIAIAAGKGGVGKSSLTVNLARALRDKSQKVGILDADFYGPSTRQMLPERRLPGRKGNVLTPAICEGISLLSMAYFKTENESIAVRAPIVNQIIQQFINQTDWGELDYLIIDFPPGTGDIQISLCQQLQITAALMLTSPQQVSVSDVRKAYHLFKQMNVPVLGIVENFSFLSLEGASNKVHVFGEGGGALLSQELGLPLFAQLPIDPEFARYCDEGDSILEKKPESLLTLELKKIAELLIQHIGCFEEQSEGFSGEFHMEFQKK